MKKIFTAILLSSLSLSYAQASSTPLAPAEATEYTQADAPSLYIFTTVIEEQSKKAGVDASLVWKAINAILFLEHKYDFRELSTPSETDLPQDELVARGEKWLKMHKIAVADRNPLELIAYAKEISGQAASGVYDFSSRDMFLASVYVQAFKEGLSPKALVNAINELVYAEYKAILDEISGKSKRNKAVVMLASGIIKGKNAKEIIAAAGKFPRYDYSSMEAFNASFEKRRRADDVDKYEASDAILMILKTEYEAEFFAINSIEDKTAAQAQAVKLVKKALGNKSPQEVIEYAAALAKSQERYDFSSNEAFEKSFEEQCEKDGVKKRDARKAVMRIMMLEYGKDATEISQINGKEEQKEEFLKLTKKVLDNRSPKEVIEYAEKGYGSK